MAQTVKYAIKPGTTMKVQGRSLTVMQLMENGYQVHESETAHESLIPFETFTESLQLPGFHLIPPMASNAKHNRSQGTVPSAAWSDKQKETAEFHLAICSAISAFQTETRKESDDPNYRVSERKLDQPAVRKFIRSEASSHFGEPIEDKQSRGGKTTRWRLYSGRTLCRYFRIFEALGTNDSSSCCTFYPGSFQGK